MTKTFAKSALAGIAGVVALSAAVAAPGFASAQSSNYYGGGYYDPCQRSTSNRGTTGGVIGALAGAAIGSNVAARNARTEGAVLGGLLGAALGSKVGKDSAACGSQQRQSYYGSPQYGSNGYADSSYYGGYGEQGYGYGNTGYGNSGYDNGAGYSNYGRSYGVADRNNTGAENCSLAESPIYLPDGRVQKRFVRVCQDSRGRYQVVD